MVMSKMANTQRVHLVGLNGSEKDLVINRETDGDRTISFDCGEMHLIGRKGEDPDSIVTHLASLMSIDREVLAQEIGRALATMELHRVADLLLS
jgi:hypothetical protein